MNRTEPRRLVVGDKCALLSGTSVYAVEVSEVRILCAGDPIEFAMYRVKSNERYSRWFEQTSQHRADLFALPTERQLLIDRLESDIDALQSLLHEQEQERENDDEAVQHERAADAAMEVDRG